MDPLLIKNYSYQLPEERIASEPLAQRDQSKLLVCRKGEIIHSIFQDLAQFLPTPSTLYFNDTKVIPARLLFLKDSGATIECFLLNPIRPSTLIATTLASTGSCVWQCAIGNLKRWSDGLELTTALEGLEIKARLLDRDKSWVEFSWKPAGKAFATIMEVLGNTPLPPYIKRKPNPGDRDRYQTVYASNDGAVAAPTAGLHFTPAVLESLRSRDIKTDFLTLHVGAGTFQPVKVENAKDHTMHEEQVMVTRKTLEDLLEKRTVVAVGTTSMRLLESLYWFGVVLGEDRAAEFNISQTDPYTRTSTLSKEESLERVLEKMKQQNTDQLTGRTSIFLHPGYTFRVVDALITNFHQPASTLLLLVAAFAGPGWKKIYDEALKNGYRFLSYGDSSLLLKSSV
jgi:S-adenosylmethionine:tRNA ribosyltransferase-isomerase